MNGEILVFVVMKSLMGFIILYWFVSFSLLGVVLRVIDWLMVVGVHDLVGVAL